MKFRCEMEDDTFTDLWAILGRLSKVLTDEQLCDVFGCMSEKKKAEAIKDGDLEYHIKSYASVCRSQLKDMRKALKPAHLDFLQHMHSHLDEECGL